MRGRPNLGYGHVHNAVDAHSRLAYTGIPADQTKEPAAAFCKRAQAFFTAAGGTARRVPTDSGACYRCACYRSRLRRDTLTAAGITPERTRAYQSRHHAGPAAIG